MLVKILGAIDLLAAFVLLTIIFGFHPWLQLVLFCAGLLLLKGMFVLTGDILSIVDLLSSLILLTSVFFAPFTILLWLSAFLLLAKGVTSFL